MALQGDLKSFALPDVLRLLAATGKSGCLEVGSPDGAGEVRFHRGGILGGSVASAPHAIEPADVVFELLRLEDGSFAFDEGDQPEGPVADVEATIVAAEELVAEWAEVEAVVPSMRAWITLAAEIDAEVVEVTASQWQALAAIGGGGNVRDLATALELTDLAACRVVKDLAETRLVEVRASHGYTPLEDDLATPTYQLDSFEEFEVAREPVTELEDLSAEDRPVVMEEREDALLPEPLPGEGVAYEGEEIVGHVDGHAFDHIDGPDAPTGEEPALDPTAALDAASSGFDPFDEIHPATVTRVAASDDQEDGGATPFPPAPIVESGSATSGDVYDALSPERLDQESSPLEPIPGAPDLDEERTSLLRFLSSVKS